MAAIFSKEQSLSPYKPSLSYSFSNHQQRQQLPPLLPLPVYKSDICSSLPSQRTRKRRVKRQGKDNHAKVTSYSRGLSLESNQVVLSDLDKLSGSLYAISPPPSSLPLPKFSLRRQGSCKAEASGFDAGATDDLRELLRLR